MPPNTWRLLAPGRAVRTCEAHPCPEPPGAPLAPRQCPIRTAARTPSAQERARPASAAGPAAAPHAAGSAHNAWQRQVLRAERRGGAPSDSRASGSCAAGPIEMGGGATTPAPAQSFFTHGGRPPPPEPPLSAARGRAVRGSAGAARAGMPAMAPGCAGTDAVDGVGRSSAWAVDMPSGVGPADPARACRRRLTADGNMPECACRMRPWPAAAARARAACRMRPRCPRRTRAPPSGGKTCH